MIPHYVEIGKRLVVAESHKLALGVVVDFLPIEGDNFVGCCEGLDGLVKDLLTVVKHIEDYVFFDDLPALNVPQNGVLYLWADQVLDHWRDLTVLALVLEQGFI